MKKNVPVACQEMLWLHARPIAPSAGKLIDSTHSHHDGIDVRDWAGIHNVAANSCCVAHLHQMHHRHQRTYLFLEARVAIDGCACVCPDE